MPSSMATRTAAHWRARPSMACRSITWPSPCCSAAAPNGRRSCCSSCRVRRQPPPERSAAESGCHAGLGRGHGGARPWHLKTERAARARAMFTSRLFMVRMSKGMKLFIVMAVLIAGGGALYGLMAGIQQRRERSSVAVEECLQGARMAFDVHWAAACATQAAQASSGQADGHAECDLPDAKAAVVNAWLDQDERRCVSEMRAGLDR